MKTTPITKIIKQIVKESIAEAHQQGEWWIDNGGELQQQGEAGQSGEELMATEHWKRMKSSGGKIEITTYELRAEDLRIILQGIEKIMAVEKPADDPDDVVQKDGYAGPRVDIHLQKKGKSFKSVPLGILKKCLPSKAKNYEDGKEPELAGPLMEKLDYHTMHKGYRLYEGNRHIVAIFEDNSRLVFEVHYHDKHGEDRDKWRKRAASRWKTLANEIYRDVQLTEVGNPIQKSWKQSFEEALKHPELEEFIRDPEKHKRVYPIADPVNFTPRV